MWVDDISLSYVDEAPEMQIDFIDHPPGDEIEVLMSVTRDFNIRVSNLTNSESCGEITSTVYYTMRANLLDAATNAEVPRDFCLSALETRDLIMRVTPDALTQESRVMNIGVAFAAADQILNDTESTARSLSDSNVERRWKPIGSHDAVISSDFIRARVVAEFTKFVFQSGFEK